MWYQRSVHTSISATVSCPVRSRWKRSGPRPGSSGAWIGQRSSSATTSDTEAHTPTPDGNHTITSRQQPAMEYFVHLTMALIITYPNDLSDYEQQFLDFVKAADEELGALYEGEEDRTLIIKRDDDCLRFTYQDRPLAMIYRSDDAIGPNDRALLNVGDDYSQVSHLPQLSELVHLKIREHAKKQTDENL